MSALLCETGMRGDFLGEAALRWEDFTVGRESTLNLVQRERIHSGPVQGTVTIFVGDPTIELAQNEADVSSYEQLAGSSVEIEREVSEGVIRRRITSSGLFVGYNPECPHTRA